MSETKKAVHPAMAARCSGAQIAAFNSIAAHGNTGYSRATLAALERKGLIVFVERHAQDRLGRFTWREPTVPTHLHLQWCEWCADEEARLSALRRAAIEAAAHD